MNQKKDMNNDEEPFNMRKSVFQAERQDTNNYLATLTQQGADEEDGFSQPFFSEHVEKMQL